MTNIVVTPSTSLVLIQNLSTPTSVLFPSYTAPNFSVTVRDTTGLVNVGASSIRLSTIGTARFLDGTNVYVLDKPYGLVNLSFRSSIWQILHTSGQAPATAAANVTSLETSTSVFSFLSSGIKYASSLLVDTLLTTNAITLNNTFILQNLSVPGIVVIQSSFNVYGDVQVDKQLFVSGPVHFLSSLFVNQFLPISSVFSVQGTLAVGKTLSVGGITYVQGTLGTLSTNYAETVQVQQSTPSQTALQVMTFEANGSVSSLLGLTTRSEFKIPGLLQISQDVSSLSGHVSTQSLDVGNEGFFSKSISTMNSAVFLSTLAAANNLTIQSFGFLSSSLDVGGDMFTSSLSSVSFSTLRSLSTGTFEGLSTILIQGGLSTAILDSRGLVSIGTSFVSLGVVSSMNNTVVGGRIEVQASGIFSNVFISGPVGVANDTIVSGNSFLGELRIRGGLSTLGTTFVHGYTEVLGSVGVNGNVTIDSNIIVQDGSVISSFFVNSFLLSNVEILTSSPFQSFTASTLNASSIITGLTQIAVTSPPTLSVVSTFASTTQFTTAIAEAVRVQTVRASNVAWGESQTILSAESKPQFVLNTNSLFPSGVSAQIVRAQTILADILSGTFLGDGANISNIAVPYAHLSALKTVASTVSTALLTGSTLAVSSFYSDLFTRAVSSFSTPTLLIQAAGYTPLSTVNQLLAIRSNAMLLNYGIYFDTLLKRVGVQTSTPQYALDINGSLYASNVIYNTINSLGFSTNATLYLSTVNTNSTIVRDRVFYPPGGLEVLATGSMEADFLLQTTNIPNSTFGLFSYTSTIGLNNSVFVHNDLQRVMVNGLSNGTFVVPPYDFSVQDKIYVTNAFVSSLNLSQTLNTASFNSGTLRIQYTPELQYNTLSTTNRILYLNNLISVTNEGPSLSVKGLIPQASLDVRGNAYFSTVTCTGVVKPSFYLFGSQTL